jgi:DNA-directed RNA polymerase specialized sigma24 family protein
MTGIAAHRSSTASPEESVGQPDFQALILSIQHEDLSAAGRLSETMAGAVRLMLRRSGMENPEAKVDEILFNAIDAIRTREVNTSSGLLQFVRVAVLTRKPCTQALSNQTILYHQQVTRALSKLPDRHREVVRRFYFLDQLPEFICGEMGITLTQFETAKSSAKSALLSFRRSSRCASRD